ncbi:hypothetical protein PR048_012631 [Dryococelus australis]|uniref:Uncharacterized protein n=1 Tax=Dryococelus australis TaxID=614101 RepID=A0ABQ9HQJ4_9NEOP|nr:hypothetical protein PR048_012631 [Dryococelus australis]
MVVYFNVTEKLNLRVNTASFQIYFLAYDYKNIAIWFNIMGEDEVADYCEPEKNILHAQYVFFARKQGPGETFEQFLTDVKNLGKSCSFQAEDEILRDKIVLGCSNRHTQWRLLVEGDVIIDCAIEILRLAEITRIQAEQVQRSRKAYMDGVDRSSEQSLLTPSVPGAVDNILTRMSHILHEVADVISEGCDGNTNYYCHSVTSCVNSVLSWHQELVFWKTCSVNAVI